MATRALRLVHRIAAPPLSRLLRPVVTGIGHLPDRGGVVLAANHISNLDNYLLSAVSPRPVAYLGKQELARGLFGAFNLAMGMVPIERGGADLTAVRRVAELVRSGDVVALFPEGTRSPTGQLFRFHSGAARIAHLAGAPVIPVGIRGTETVWPRGRRPVARRPDHGVLQVGFGAPLEPPAEPRGSARRQWTETLRAQVSALSGQPLVDAFAPMEQASDRPTPPGADL